MYCVLKTLTALPSAALPVFKALQALPKSLNCLTEQGAIIEERSGTSPLEPWFGSIRRDVCHI